MRFFGFCDQRKKTTAVVFVDRRSCAFGRPKHNQKQPRPADPGIGSRFRKSAGSVWVFVANDENGHIDLAKLDARIFLAGVGVLI